MEKLHLFNPDEVKINKLVASEQKQFFLSIWENLSALTHQFHLVLRTKPRQIKTVLHLYRNFLVFKEQLETHLKHEQVVIHTLAQEIREENFSIPATSYNKRSFFPEQRLQQLKDELSGLINTLNELRDKYNFLKNDLGGLNKFFKELDNLNIFLNMYKNLLKNVFTKKIALPEYEIDFHLEAS